MKTPKISIIFAGTPNFACPALEALIKDDRFEVKAVISQIDKPVGRKQIITPPAVKQLAQKFGIPVFQPIKIKEITEELQKLSPDFLVVIAYGQILPLAILQIAKWNINLHGSILPKYRGASPIQTSLLNGDTETGVSVMNIEAKMDAGAVYKIYKIAIDKDDNTATLFTKIANLGQKLPNDLYEIAQGLNCYAQDEKLVSYCQKITKEDGIINWQTETAKQILNKIRAFTPWPSAFFYWHSQRIKILTGTVINNNEAILIKQSDFSANLIQIKYLNKDYWVFKTKQDYFLPQQVVPEGKKETLFTINLLNEPLINS